MTVNRKIIGHPPQYGQGPHVALPAGFAPLRLTLQDLDFDVEVNCPMAIVGRHTDVDLRLAFADVSRRHCQFLFDNGVWRLLDLNSLNGVFVNSQRVLDVPLYAGDQVRIGCVTMLVLAGTPLNDDNEKLRQIADVLPTRN